MKTRTRSLLSAGGLLVALLAVIVLVSSQATAAPGYASGVLLQAPGGPVITALPAETCTLVDTTRTCELWAMPGEITMPDGEVVPIWGFADNPAGPALLPGPMLIANQGETIEVVLHNELQDGVSLAETVSLVFPGQPGLMPDLVGVPAGSSTTYSFVVDNPGTFLYEAGLTENGTRQVAMGLYGALVVRPPNPVWAYDDDTTAFQDEELLVLSEIDPSFNNDPFGFEMQFYQPRYWMINGKAYPETIEIETVAGNMVLLRYINAGLETHSMGLLGLQQRIIGSDGRPKTWPHQIVAEQIASGQTLDTLVSIPADSEEGILYPVYQSNLILHNASQQNGLQGPVAYGGMMTFIRTVTGGPAVPTGPLASPVSVNPNPTTGDAGIRLTARFESQIAGVNVVAAEYFTDTAGATGTGVPLAITPAEQVTVNRDIPSSQLDLLSSGDHAFYVRGQDADGIWGPVGSVVLTLDKLGPEITGMSLSANPTNGSEELLLRATGDDRAHSGSDVVDGAYSFDGVTYVPMNLSATDQPVTAMTATLTVDTLAGLPEGENLISITAEDWLGNITDPAAVITLTLDQTGPEAPVVTLDPALLDLSGAPPVTHVRLDATITDALAAGVQSPLANAEGFIDTVGPDGSGFNIFPSDGLFDEVTEDAYFEIPIANFLYRAQGDHLVYVHGLDSAGNWGILGSGTITIDRGAVDAEGPAIAALNVTLNQADRAVSADVRADAADPLLLSNVVGAEWFVDTDPGEGNGFALNAADGTFDMPNETLAATIDVSAWVDGDHTLYVRALDGSGFWGEVASVRIGQTKVYLPLLIRNQ